MTISESKSVSNKKYLENHRAENAERSLKYYYAHKQESIDRVILWQKNNPERTRAKTARWRKNNPDVIRNKDYISRYGISLDEYNEIYERQGGVCAICGKPETVVFKGKLKNLAVDHNHKTGAVRGLLCFRCNAAIGYLQDDVLVAGSLIEYLGGDNED